MSELGELYTVEQVTKFLGFTNMITVYRLTRQRKIDVVIIGRQYRYTKEAIDKYLRSCTLYAKNMPEPIINDTETPQS